jgi:hypothetical protein
MEVFQPPTYVSIGDPYQKPRSKGIRDQMHRGKQFESSVPKKGFRNHVCNQDALFEAKFMRLTEGDDYREKNPNRPYAKDDHWFSPEGRKMRRINGEGASLNAWRQSDEPTGWWTRRKGFKSSAPRMTDEYGNTIATATYREVLKKEMRAVAKQTAMVPQVPSTPRKYDRRSRPTSASAIGADLRTAARLNARPDGTDYRRRPYIASEKAPGFYRRNGVLNAW